MNNKLKCIKPFSIQNCDDDGFYGSAETANPKR